MPVEVCIGKVVEAEVHHQTCSTHPTVGSQQLRKATGTKTQAEAAQMRRTLSAETAKKSSHPGVLEIRYYHPLLTLPITNARIYLIARGANTVYKVEVLADSTTAALGNPRFPGSAWTTSTSRRAA